MAAITEPAVSGLFQEAEQERSKKEKK